MTMRTNGTSEKNTLHQEKMGFSKDGTSRESSIVHKIITQENRRRNKHGSTRMGVDPQCKDTTLSATPDQLRWKWTAGGTYSAKSCYLATFQGSMTSYSWKLIWKNWAPPRVKFFHWLADQDRCWTGERLARHGLQHNPRCPLRDQAVETIHHLLLECPFARQTWHEILAWLRMTAPAPDQERSLMDWWLRAKQNTPKPLRKGLGSITLLTPWMLWKHRNDCVFEGPSPGGEDQS